MYPGIWTAFLIEDTLPEAITKLHSWGWNAFEVSTEHLDMIMQARSPKAEIEKTLQVVRNLKVKVPQSHSLLSADVTSLDQKRRNSDIKRILSHFEISAKLGVKNTVLHPGPGVDFSCLGGRKRALEANARAFKVLCDAAGGLGLRIGVENLYDKVLPPRHRRFGALPEELVDLVDAVDSPAFGITVDTSHASLQGLDIPRMVRELGKRIVCTHLSDNDGSGGDQHKTPGSGQIDWTAVIGAFRDIGYKGILNLEIPGERSSNPEIMRLKAIHAANVMKSLLKS